MKVKNRSIVTTPGASEPQGSAVVGGSGVKPGSNVAGPLRSSSSDREDTGVVSQAPVVLITTVAERTNRTKRVSHSVSDPTQGRSAFDPTTSGPQPLTHSILLPPDCVAAHNPHKADSVHIDAKDFKRQCSSGLEFKNNRIDEANRSNEVLKHKLDDQQRANEQQQSHINKFVEVVKELLKEKSKVEIKEMTRRCTENRLRLGQFIMQRVGVEFKQIWVDGYAFQELSRKQEEITSKIEEVKRQKKMLTNRQQSGKRRPVSAPLVTLSVPDAGSEGRATGSAATVPRVITASCTALGVAASPKPKAVTPSLPWREYCEANEILKLRHAALKKESADLLSELKKLDLEKNAHRRELLIIKGENESNFKNHPLLNDRYLFLAFLGKGGYGEVHKAFDLKEQRYVACKVHRLNEDWKDTKKANYIKRALREYNVQKTLNHPRIVKLYDVFQINANSFCTVLEYCDGQDLYFYLKQHNTLPEREARSIIMQVVSAVKYLNEIRPAVIHYDLKPGNILRAEDNGEIKISDFGLCKVMENDHYDPDYGMDLTSPGAGTYWYLPPECFEVDEQPPKISSKVDVWSIGVIFYECLYGIKPFGQNQSPATIWKKGIILNATEVHFPSKPIVSDEAKNFIRHCLCHCKKDRIDIAALSKHAYLQRQFRKHGRSELAFNQQ